MCPKILITVISGYHDLGILFCSWKRFGRFETVASLDAYQITKISFFQKLIIFRCLIFEKFKKKVSKSGVSWPIAWEGVIKRFIRFFKIVPLGYHIFIQMISQWKEVFIKVGSLPTVITNSFRTSVVQKLENIFNHIFFLLHWDLFSFRSMNKIHDDKTRPKQVYSCKC